MSDTTTPKIRNAVISPISSDPFGPIPVITIFLDTAPEEPVRLFDFYPDEISFSAGELIGLTMDEARQLKVKKDQAWLRS